MENPHQHRCRPGKLEAALVPSACLWFAPLQTRFFFPLCKHAHPAHHLRLPSAGTARHSPDCTAGANCALGHWGAILTQRAAAGGADTLGILSSSVSSVPEHRCRTGPFLPIRPHLQGPICSCTPHPPRGQPHSRILPVDSPM